MLKEIRNTLLVDIKAATEIDMVDKYRGEFGEGSGWSPNPTNCFIQVIGKSGFIRSADNKVLKWRASLKIFAGANYNQDRDGLDVVEQLETYLDNQTLAVNFGTETEPDIKNYRMQISPDGWDLIYTELGFEGYAFTLFIL